MHTLAPLPYAYEALEPHLDAATMRLHHDKHHQTYLDKLNAALESEAELASLSVEDLLWQFAAKVESSPAAAAIRNHGGGFVNHNMFWEIMSPSGARQPVGQLAAAIASKFGNFADFQTQFVDVASKHFGSGWAWLVLDENKGLQLYSTPNQDSPLMSQHYPVMGVDVWEHAYYLKYQNRRPGYLEAIWQVLDWEKIEARYQAGLSRPSK